jgi:hypothetical protein
MSHFQCSYANYPLSRGDAPSSLAPGFHIVAPLALRMVQFDYEAQASRNSKQEQDMQEQDMAVTLHLFTDPAPVPAICTCSVCCRTVAALPASHIQSAVSER